jgi:hypothetical protein
MIEKNFFKVQNEFVEDLGSLSGSAVKLYLILRRNVNEKRNDDNKVFPSYKYIQRLMKTKSSNTVTNAIAELQSAGWITEKTKGNSYNHLANTYYMPDKKVTPDHENNGRATIENDGNPTIEDTVSLPSNQLTNKTDNNKTNINKKNNNQTNFLPSSFHSEENYLGYPFKCAWLLKAMVDADVFRDTPPTFGNNLKLAKKWAAQLNNLVLLGAKEQILQVIPQCLYDGFKIDEPAQITERLNAHISQGRFERETENNRVSHSPSKGDDANNIETNYFNSGKRPFVKPQPNYIPDIMKKLLEKKRMETEFTDDDVGISEKEE